MISDHTMYLKAKVIICTNYKVLRHFQLIRNDKKSTTHKNPTVFNIVSLSFRWEPSFTISACYTIRSTITEENNVVLLNRLNDDIKKYGHIYGKEECDVPPRQRNGTFIGKFWWISLQIPPRKEIHVEYQVVSVLLPYKENIFFLCQARTF